MAESSWLRAATVASLIGIVGMQAVAQAPPVAGQSGPRRPPFSPNPEVAGPSIPIEALIERRIRLIEELSKMIAKEVELSAETSTSLRKIIDQEIQSLRKLAQVDWASDEPLDTRPTPEEIVELKKELDLAREAGDEERADELVNRILYGGDPQRSSRAVFKEVLDPPNDMFAAILEIVPQKNQATVAKVCRRWWALYPKWVIDHGAMRVLRALNDPALGLDKSVRKPLTLRLQKSLISGRRIAQMGLDKQQEAADEFLAKIKPELSAAQWEHLIATVKVLDEWAAKDRAAIEQVEAARAAESSEAHP